MPVEDDDKNEIKALAAEVKAKFGEQLDKVKEIAEGALSKYKELEGKSDDAKLTVDEALTKMSELGEQMKVTDQALADLAQKEARHGGNPERQKTPGELLTEDDKFKAWADNEPRQGKQDVRIKATLTSATTAAAGSVGDAIFPTVLPGMVEQPQRRMTVRDLITPGRMDSSSLEYVRETGFTNNAAPVAEGAAKPSSDIELELVTTSAKVIAHWMKASRQVLSDIPMLRSTIDQRLMFGLDYVEEVQLLSGDGTGQNLSGMITEATAFAESFVPADANLFDTFRLAMLQAALAEYPASGHILNPIDFAKLEMTKDGNSNYILGNARGNMQATLWGLPTVQTQAMGSGKFMTGAFKLAAQLFDRWDSRVETGYENDDFTKNLVTILAEERLALAIYRPEALIYGDVAIVTA